MCPASKSKPDKMESVEESFLPRKNLYEIAWFSTEMIGWPTLKMSAIIAFDSIAIIENSTLVTQLKRVHVSLSGHDCWVPVAVRMWSTFVRITIPYFHWFVSLRLGMNVTNDASAHHYYLHTVWTWVSNSIAPESQIGTETQRDGERILFRILLQDETGKGNH